MPYLANAQASVQGHRSAQNRLRLFRRMLREEYWVWLLQAFSLSRNCQRRLNWVAAFWGLVLAAVSSGGWVRAAEPSDDTGLAEITVTAQKYNSTIQNTPISMSALSGAELAAAGINTVEGMATEVPGLSMRSAGPGQTEYEARGLASNGGAAATVGFYLDEVPISPSAISFVGRDVIDPDLYDINRIEVLRGPQGTLYGSGSMGGTIKVITNQPQIGITEGSVQGTLSGTEGGGVNGGGAFMFNLPIGDTLAVRLVGSDSWRSGWIDRIVVSPFPTDTATRGNVLGAPVQSIDNNDNTVLVKDGRISILYKPNSDFSILATAMSQQMSMGAYDEFDSPPGAAYMARYEAFPLREPISDLVHLYSLTMTANVGFADLTSATSYWNRNLNQFQDASESIAYTIGAAQQVPVTYNENDITSQFSQEIRLTSHGDDRLRWIAGAFYESQLSTWKDFAANPLNTAAPKGIYFSSDNTYRLQQFAAFADGTYSITDALKLSAGLRWYRYTSRQFENEWGSLAPNLTPLATPLETENAQNGFNPRLDLSYSPSDSLTTYISASKGFRPGGVNQVIPPPNEPPYCSPSPLTYSSDGVWDYEIGEKAKLNDRRLSINSDFYYIKWSNVQQFFVLACGFAYTGNAGTGRSFGPEVEISAKLSDEWSVTVNGAYTDAKLTQPSASYKYFLQYLQPGGVSTCPAGGSSCTAPILNVPKVTASVALAYETDVTPNLKLTARVDDNYVGASYDEAYYFGIRLPPYSIANARIGLSKDHWTARFFVNNLTNKVAEITANNTSWQFNIPAVVRYSTNQPRTFGTEINYRF
jgi:iron complex outermembrane receptor protein